VVEKEGTCTKSISPALLNAALLPKLPSRLERATLARLSLCRTSLFYSVPHRYLSIVESMYHLRTSGFGLILFRRTSLHERCRAVVESFSAFVLCVRISVLTTLCTGRRLGATNNWNGSLHPGKRHLPSFTMIYETRQHVCALRSHCSRHSSQFAFYSYFTPFSFLAFGSRTETTLSFFSFFMRPLMLMTVN